MKLKIPLIPLSQFVMASLLLILVFLLSRQAAAIRGGMPADSSSLQTRPSPSSSPRPLVVLDSGHGGMYYRPKNTDSEWGE